VRRFMMLVTLAVLMTAMLVLTMSPALSITFTKPIDKASPVLSAVSSGGTPVPTVVCNVVGDASGTIGWQNGQCWVFYLVA
jgi:hypothetical protein